MSSTDAAVHTSQTENATGSVLVEEGSVTLPSATNTDVESEFDPLDLATPIKFNYPQTVEGKLEECMRLKGIANARFGAKMYFPAIRVYARAIAYVKGLDSSNNPLNSQMAEMLGPKAKQTLDTKGNSISDATKDEIRAQTIFLNTNIALAYFKLGKMDKTIEFCDKALQLDPGYPKALLRKAEALIGLGDTRRAQTIIDQVTKDAPEFMGTKTLTKLQKKIKAVEKKALQKQRKAFGGMFNKKPAL